MPTRRYYWAQILVEVFVERAAWDGADVMLAKEAIGHEAACCGRNMRSW